jgi:hypothetical protein
MTLNKIQKAMLDTDVQEKLNEIGDLFGLNTTKKTSLVEAVNETVTGLADKTTDLEGRGLNPIIFGAVGNGIADDTVIINSLAATGKDIFIPKGKTFKITSTIILDSVKLYGGGTLLKGNPTLQNFIVMKGESPTVQGVKFIAADSASTARNVIYIDEGAKNVTISNNDFKDIGSTYCAITASNPADGNLYSLNVDGLSIIENTFDGFSRHLFLASVDNLKVIGNTFRKSRHDSIRTRRNMRGIIITNNHFLNIGQYVEGNTETKDFIDAFWSGRDMIISNNYMENCASVGIDIKGVSSIDDLGLDGVNSKVIITNNIIKKTRASSISLKGDLGKNFGQYIIKGNLLSESGVGATDRNLSAVVVSGVGTAQVEGNFIFSNYGRGILLNNNIENGAILGYAIITGNTFQNNGSADIRYDISKGCLITNNIFAPFDSLLFNFGKNQVSKIETLNAGQKKTLSIQNNIFDGDELVIGGSGDAVVKHLASFSNNLILGEIKVQRNSVNLNNGSVYFTDFGSIASRENWKLENYNLGDMLVRQNGTSGGEVIKIVGLDSVSTPITGTVTTITDSPVINTSADFDFTSVSIGDLLTFPPVLGVYQVLAKDSTALTLTVNKQAERSASSIVANKRTKKFLSITGN